MVLVGVGVTVGVDVTVGEAVDVGAGAAVAICTSLMIVRAVIDPTWVGEYGTRGTKGEYGTCTSTTIRSPRLTSSSLTGQIP